MYYQQSANKVRWFGIADKVSRECVTGLGAKHCASYLPFAVSKILGNPAIYTWRQVGGETLLANGFSNFRGLFNTDFQGNLNEARAWDITQLKREQSLLQPIHERFFSQHPWFVTVNKNIMRLCMRGGVNLLNKADRVRYGCFLMNYTKAQGCQW